MKKVLAVFVSLACIMVVLVGCQQISEEDFYTKTGDAGMATSDMAVSGETAELGIVKYGTASKDNAYSIEYFEFSNGSKAESYYNNIVKKYNELFDKTDSKDVFVEDHNEYILDTDMFYMKAYRKDTKLVVLSVKDLSYKNTALKIFNDIVMK
jgi:hypothetical protein